MVEVEKWQITLSIPYTHCVMYTHTCRHIHAHIQINEIKHFLGKHVDMTLLETE